MVYVTKNILHKARPGGWLPKDPAEIQRYIQKLRKRAKENPQPLIQPIQEFKEMVNSDPVLSGNMTSMFSEAAQYEKYTPLGWQAEPQTFDEFLILLNQIMTEAPECYQTGSAPNQQPAGLIGFPINALLDWPMGTSYGYDVFSNALVNQQFKKILSYWSNFLVTPDSRHTLAVGDPNEDSIAWLSTQGQAEMVSVAYNALGAGPNPISPTTPFSGIFNCNPNEPYYGFTSWDDFFTRTFAPGIRPVSAPADPTVIVNACESGPLAIQPNVALSDTFWIKEQRYSLENMLNFDEYATQFDGGTVYQAFLSALSYHRWHSPVDGIIDKAYVVNGTYYLENIYQGFSPENPDGADPSAPNDSQAFITSVASRAIIFIKADNPNIGLMCVVAVGMAEVSSCEITVQRGNHVNKGDQIGMFHFGGSTHCLVFRPGVNLSFNTYGEQPGVEAPNNIRVNTLIAQLNQ